MTAAPHRAGGSPATVYIYIYTCPISLGGISECGGSPGSDTPPAPPSGISEPRVGQRRVTPPTPRPPGAEWGGRGGVPSLSPGEGAGGLWPHAGRAPHGRDPGGAAGGGGAGRMSLLFPIMEESRLHGDPAGTGRPLSGRGGRSPRSPGCPRGWGHGAGTWGRYRCPGVGMGGSGPGGPRCCRAPARVRPWERARGGICAPRVCEPRGARAGWGVGGDLLGSPRLRQPPPAPVQL